MLKVRALGDTVVVKPIKIEKVHTTDTGKKIHLAHDYVEREKGGCDRGTIISIGPCAWDIYKETLGDQKWAEVGDQVMWPRYAGNRVNLDEDEEEYVFVLKDRDVLVGWEN